MPNMTMNEATSALREWGRFMRAFSKVEEVISVAANLEVLESDLANQVEQRKKELANTKSRLRDYNNRCEKAEVENTKKLEKQLEGLASSYKTAEDQHNADMKALEETLAKSQEAHNKAMADLELELEAKKSELAKLESRITTAETKWNRLQRSISKLDQEFNEEAA